MCVPWRSLRVLHGESALHNQSTFHQQLPRSDFLHQRHAGEQRLLLRFLHLLQHAARPQLGGDWRLPQSHHVRPRSQGPRKLTQVLPHPLYEQVFADRETSGGGMGIKNGLKIDRDGPLTNFGFLVAWEAQVVGRQSPMRKSLIEASKGVRFPLRPKWLVPPYIPGQGSAIPREGRGEGCFRGGLLKGCASSPRL